MFRRLLVFVLVLPTLSGCFSLTTYQSARVLEPGEKVVGAGLGGFVEATDGGASVGLLDLYGRMSLSPEVDAGVKVTGFPLLGGLVFADVKRQVLRDPLYVAADLGASVFVSFIYDETGPIYLLGLYPMVLAGTEHVYAGARLSLLGGGNLEDDALIDFTGVGVLPGAVVGGKFGTRLQVLPELNLYVLPEDGSVLLVPALGLQYSFGGE